MTAFHLQARCFEGPLSKPARDEWRQCETDNPEDARRWATQAHADGYTVWIYDHSRSNVLPSACDWLLLAQVRPAQGNGPAVIAAVLGA